MIAAWFTPQLVFDGLVNGLVYGLMALGLVLVYRSTKVINFAVGNIGIVGGGLLALTVINYGFPFWIALVISLAVGALFGVVIELSVIRRLFNSPRVIVLVATVGVAQLALAIVASYPETDRQSDFPVAIGSHWSDLFGTGVDVIGPQLTILVVVPLVAAALGWLLNRTTFGRAITASADNRPLARLSGVNPKTVSTFVWVVAGLLSTVAIILLSGRSGSVTGLASLGPLTLARAMVAATVAGMYSFRRALMAGMVIGVLEAILRFNVVEESGLVDFVVFAMVIVAVLVQRSRDHDEVFAFAPKAAVVPARLRKVGWVRALAYVVPAMLFIGAVVLPIVVSLPSRHLLYSTILCFAICAASVTLVTGWAGQLSLAQMTFAGFGALIAAALTRGVEIDVLGVQAEAPALPFVVSILVAAVIVSGIAALVGLGALRVRGLMLGVVTFVFAVTAQQYLFARPILSNGEATSVPFRRGSLFGIDLTSHRTYYYVCLAVLVLVLVVLARIRATGSGRRIIGVRDNADGAAAYTIDPARNRIMAFAFAGAIAAVGGALLAGVVQSVPFGERFFLVDDSLRVVGMVVIGGVGSVLGGLLGALWIVGLPAFFPDNEVVPLFTSSVGLLLIVMYFPGGFTQIGSSMRSALLAWAQRRLPDEAPTDGVRPASSVVGGRRVTRTRDSEPESRSASSLMSGDDAGLAVLGAMLDVQSVSVAYGGLQAVAEASIEVGHGEIVGLIGTNGAGKSTLMNAVGGFARSSGSILLDGTDVSGRSAAQRAGLGLGRTFQAARLFPELTVRETVQLALEGRDATRLIETTLLLPTSFVRERRQRAAADDLIDFLGLGRYADRYVSELSTGTRRIVELGGLLALGAHMLCLDEPTAGVAQRESEAFGPLLVQIRLELGAAMLIVEHDMPLIMSISDRVYCLERGAVIACGDPATVRNDERVVGSYLGTDERAIARSGLVDSPV
jgi:ABC-type branched-subunit amino acid transport system ATPase component/ABC-type branched-subunit amino acid transport system permease subunit